MDEIRSCASVSEYVFQKLLTCLCPAPYPLPSIHPQHPQAGCFAASRLSPAPPASWSSLPLTLAIAATPLSSLRSCGQMRLQRPRASPSPSCKFYPKGAIIFSTPSPSSLHHPYPPPGIALDVLIYRGFFPLPVHLPLVPFPLYSFPCSFQIIPRAWPTQCLTMGTTSPELGTAVPFFAPCSPNDPTQVSREIRRICGLSNPSYK